MADDKRIDIMEGNAQIGNGQNMQFINPTTTNNTTTNNNPTIINNGLHVSFHSYYLGNDLQPVAQNSTASHHLTREQLLQLQQLSQSGLLPEEAVQQVTDVVRSQQSTELTSQSCDECIIRSRPQCSKCGQRTTPGQSVPPPSQSFEESTQPPQSPESRRPLSDHQQSRNRRRAPDRKQISSQRNKLTDRQPSNQTPGCSESDQTCRVPAEERVPSTQPAPTKTPDDIQIYDSKGRVLQPGDGVIVGSGFSWYFGIYIGNMQVIRCDEETQKVIIEKMDVPEKFNMLTSNSGGRCKIFPAQMRVERARSLIGKVSPVRETTRCGLDFVFWTFTGLNCYQAWKEGFRL